MWHLWQDQIQGIGIGGSVETWLLPLKCRGEQGDVGLAGEIGPVSMRRLEGSKAAKEGLNLPICKDAHGTSRTDQW